MIRVLFVCLGNICRSPMAEAVFRHKVAAAGLSDRIEMDSAGTSGWHAGEPPHEGTRAVLAENGVSDAGIRSRQFHNTDLDRFDYVLTMDRLNLATIRDQGATGRAHLGPLMDYAPQMHVTEVPDPYMVGGFPHVYALTDAACDGLLAAIRRDHAL